jgi:methyl-accepting chemotaxis protein
MATFSIDLSAIASRFLQPILDRIKTLLGPFGKLIDKVKQTYDQVVNVFGAGQKLVDSVIAEVDGWRNFKSDIRFSQRVIQIERAIQKTKDLIEGIPESWRAIVDVFKTIKSQVTDQTNPAEDAESVVEDVESGGAKNLLERFPRLAKGLEKVLGALALILTALEAVAKVIHDLQTIVDELKAIRLEIEKLDTIFLSQSNKRKTLHLDNGKKIRIRLGKLHQV